MSQEEKTGRRDAHYSVWHRVRSIKRFVGVENAQRLAMIDVDASLYVEYDDETKEPVALIETARDVGQAFKTATVLRGLARRADIPAFVVLYKVGESMNPADPTCEDIESFRVQRLWPNRTRWHVLTPQRWSEALLRIRSNQAAKFDAEEAETINPVAAAKIA